MEMVIAGSARRPSVWLRATLKKWQEDPAGHTPSASLGMFLPEDPLVSARRDTVIIKKETDILFVHLLSSLVFREPGRRKGCVLQMLSKSPRGAGCDINRNDYFYLDL